MHLKGKRIFAGLSGGVDSAVTAAILKDKGAHVTGVFIKGWYPPGMPCTWAADRRDAMRVAAKLGIPFVTLDASKEYKQGVIDYLLSEYKAGRTPNPDIMCNREVKFGAFYRFAMDKGADYIATGHYAQVKNGKLLRGADPAKDQSYFLWAVPEEALKDTLMPLGALRKEETRKLAKKYGLPNASKKDSQGICFLGSISVDDFLREEFGEQELGEVFDESGKLLGTHDGVLFHTLGSRIAPEGAPPGPWYVMQKHVKENVLIASKTKEAPGDVICLADTNWFMKHEGELEAQFRYHGPLVSGRVDGPVFIPKYALPEPAAQGQSLVLYDGAAVIGGGIIE